MSRPEPTFATLLDWVDGRLDPEQAQAIAEQARGGDPRLVATVEWLRGFLDVAGSLPLSTPPPIVRQRLRQQYAARLETGSTRTSRPAAVSADLVFDSLVDLRATGTRGGNDVMDVRHLAYSSESADVVLDVHPAGSGAVRLEGQVLPIEEISDPCFEARITSPSKELRSLEGDVLGRFHVADVPLDAATLDLTNGLLSISVALSLGKRDA